MENKETDQFLERLVSPQWVFSHSLLFWLNSHLERGGSPSLLILPWLFKIHARGSPRWGTLQYSSGCWWPT